MWLLIPIVIAFLLSVGIALYAMEGLRQGIQVIDPGKLREWDQELAQTQFKWEVARQSAIHFEQNDKLIERKSKLWRRACQLIALQIVLVIIWVATSHF